MKSYKRRISATAAMATMAMLGVTASATVALGQQGPSRPDEEQVPGYVGDLGDPNPRVRERAADMLGIIGLRIRDATILAPAVERLVSLMSDDDMEVRDETAEALGVVASRVEDEAAVKSAIAALVKGLSDGSGEVREESAEALARIAPTLEDRMLLVPAVGPLVKALEDDPATREFARQALESLGRPAGETKTSAPMKLSARDLKRDRYLVLDSRIIESKENLQLTVGVVRKDANNPLFGEDRPWEPRFDNPYCSVIYDEEEKIYKCWYSIFTRSGGRGDFPGEGLPSDKRAWVKWREGRRGFGVCYATSKDGLRWEKPELGLIEFDGNKRNNIVIRAVHGVAVMKDLHETDPQKRYKAIHPFRNHTLVWFSPDGLRWTEKKLPGLAHGDTNQAVWWDPDIGKYVLITRRWGGARTKGRYGRGGHRQKVRSVSSDFLNWSKPELVIEGLDLRMQIHDMPVVPHAGVYLGMVGLFDIEASRQWCELAWSPDSIQWRRIQPGRPLIPNGAVMGDCDWGCIFASKPIVRKDEILIYYGANDGRFMAWRNGFLCLARMRPDGFAGYEQIAGGSNRTGSLTTVPVSVVAPWLCVSADVAPSGFVRTTLLDKDNERLAEGELVTGTVTDAGIRWKDGFLLKELEGKEIKLSFELRESKLFSFSFRD